MNKFTFLIPVFNDWNSLNILLDQIDNEILNFEEEFNFIIIDDKSSSENSISKKKYKKVNLIKIIHLNKNLGSQRALAIGLKYIYVKEKKTNIILMDADGEDDPKALRKIISYSKEFPEKTQNSHSLLENVGEENYDQEDIKAWNKIVMGPKIIIDPKEEKNWQKFHPAR